MMLRTRDLPSIRPPRRGSFLVELAISAAMLMIAMGLTVKVLGFVAAERRAWDRQQVAVQEAANLMERLTARPFQEVTAESAGKLPLSPRARQSLPGVELKFDVQENGDAGGSGSKRLAIVLRWHGRSGEWDRPVRLTSWIYRGRPDR